MKHSWRADLIAGAVVAVLLIPQSLAYAMLAGLPPQVGLYASLLPLLAYAALGSSPVLGLGPVAVLALMIAQALSGLPAGVTPEAGALVLAAEIGALMALAALLRLDALSSLLSVPALRGFENGATLMIAASQLPVLLGSAAAGFTLPDLARTAMTGGWGLSSTVWGAVALALLLMSRRMGLPLLARLAPLLLLLGAMALSAFTPAAQGVAQVGALPTLALPLGLPSLDRALWLQLLPSAALVALMAFVSSFAVSESLAQRRGEKLLPAAELRGLAAANLVAAVSGGMPVAGSFSRSILLHEAGSRTRWTLVFVAAFMALAMLLLAGPLAHLPKPVLAATIVVAVLGGFTLRHYAEAWRYARAEGLLMAAVSTTVLLWSAGAALALGVVGSIALLIQRTAQPHVARLGRVPGTQHYRNVERYAVECQPEVVGLRIDESLVFTNARGLVDAVLARVQEHRERVGAPARVLLLMAPVNHIDVSGLTALQELRAALAAEGLRLELSEVKGPVLDRLRAVGWLEAQDVSLYLSHHEGMQAGEHALRPSLADMDAPGQL
ncbi:SulP family inorganic anion transporter [Roseateles asaccharophilus]|uniref:SulP family sulfate permease n=1 Tax=Roseateles asaccharophilus TaxID=582607 RepID=A0ABU2A7S6_9BURK|nr:SulP family inorganic anion transporter [Roseateles asaccharophilus]MDR7333254.1 SulP family sulfate permease [Roseateles asaccharophilus]